MSDTGEATAGVARLFDALAEVYDGVGVDFFQPIAGQLLSALPPEQGEKWLDVGCGRGAVLLPAAGRVGPDGRATGVDVSAGMVAACRAEAQRQGLHNVDVDVADARDLPFTRGQFDVIASCLVLFFVPDPGVAVRSWLPLLTPGGRLGITTFGEMDPRWSAVDDVFTPYLPAHMRDARTSGKSGPFASDASMEQLVSEAGFAEVHTVSGSVPVRFANAEQWHDFTWSTGQRVMWLSVPEAERSGVRAEAERRLMLHAKDDGSIVFEQRVRHTLARRAE